MPCLVAAGIHVNYTRARQPPIAVEELVSVGSAPRRYREDPRPAE
jgi:hypothetical protein